MVDNTDNRLIENTYRNLISEIKSYRPSTPLDIVDEAFKLAKDAHKGQKRTSGEPFIIHPLSVAKILAELRSDLESIVAGILHDVVEYSPYNLEDIEARFGKEIAQMVDGVTNLSKVEYTSKDPEYLQQTSASEDELKLTKGERGRLSAKANEQAENFRKFFFFMSKDIRVVLIKLSDRLHNMRTLGVRPPDKQKAVAQETLEIYAPLAHLLGVAKLRYQLEDLAFKYQDRDMYDELAQKIRLKQDERQALIKDVTSNLQTILHDAGIETVVEGRAKHFYSIYKKMKSKNKKLDEIYDLFAVRILVNSVTDCYAALGHVNATYQLVPDRIKDYIAMPKRNRYQSIHTTVMCPNLGEPMEIQIRTHEMHRVAEFGFAAHWKYKENSKGAKEKWLTEIMAWQRELTDNADFMDALKTNLNAFNTHIYCFSPAGDPFTLVDGATPIDFAYAVHSAVGNRMIGAKVNGSIVPNDYQLKNGDRVEILTSQNSKGPGRDWINIVKTTQARTKINQWYNRQDREVNIQRGREQLEAAAAELGVNLEDLLPADAKADGNADDNKVLQRFNCKNVEQLYVMVGMGGIKEKAVVNRLYREYEKTLPKPTNEEIVDSILAENTKPVAKHESKGGIVVDGMQDADYRLSRCCSPLPGDEIVGFITRGRGMSIHRTDCVNIIHLDELDKRRLMEAYWPVQEKPGHTYLSNLRIECEDRDGMLADITKVIRDEKIRIASLNVRAAQNVAYCDIGLVVASIEHQEHVIKKLLNEKGVYDIVRASA